MEEREGKEGPIKMDEQKAGSLTCFHQPNNLSRFWRLSKGRVFNGCFITHGKAVHTKTTSPTCHDCLPGTCDSPENFVLGKVDGKCSRSKPKCYKMIPHVYGLVVYACKASIKPSLAWKDQFNLNSCSVRRQFEEIDAAPLASDSLDRHS